VAVEFEDSRRTPRYPLAVDIEVVDIQSGIRIAARTKTLSRAGCGVETLKLLPQGTSVIVTFSHQGREAKAFARVVYSRSDLGMGLAFIHVEDEEVLDRWIAEFMSISVRNP
jgi:PilZ domain-containing protein